MKHINEHYKEWCGDSHNVNDCHPVHDSSETIEFAEYYSKELIGIDKKKNMNNLINWSEVSRLLTGNRTAIRSDYSGRKYRRKINRLIKLINLWVKWQSKT